MRGRLYVCIFAFVKLNKVFFKCKSYEICLASVHPPSAQLQSQRGKTAVPSLNADWPLARPCASETLSVSLCYPLTHLQLAFQTAVYIVIILCQLSVELHN